MSDERKVLDGASEQQLDCLVEESSGSGTMKHEGLLSLADLPQPDDFPAPPPSGATLSDMSSGLPLEPNHIKPDPAASDTSGSLGKNKTVSITSLKCYCSVSFSDVGLRGVLQLSLRLHQVLN